MSTAGLQASAAVSMWPRGTKNACQPKSSDAQRCTSPQGPGREAARGPAAGRRGGQGARPWAARSVARLPEAPRRPLRLCRHSGGGLILFGRRRLASPRAWQPRRCWPALRLARVHKGLGALGVGRPTLSPSSGSQPWLPAPWMLRASRAAVAGRAGAARQHGFRTGRAQPRVPGSIPTAGARAVDWRLQWPVPSNANELAGAAASDGNHAQAGDCVRRSGTSGTSPEPPHFQPSPAGVWRCSLSHQPRGAWQAGPPPRRWCAPLPGACHQRRSATPTAPARLLCSAPPSRTCWTTRRSSLATARPSLASAPGKHA
mmetsp:Transcript_24750/g.93623  ORF Transcript_24750/g.93623 Transcript_24750/m.93623 type:complete len:316 (+) Transcript_24750:1964-2911(+)